jgi:hypothetical protein
MAGGLDARNDQFDTVLFRRSIAVDLSSWVGNRDGVVFLAAVARPAAVWS